MDGLLHALVVLLVTYGPWLIFAATALETAAFLGLIVPAEAMVLLGAVLAQRGVLELSDVAMATVFGAFTGDQAGYLLGRIGGGRVAARPDGWLGRVWGRYAQRSALLFQRHSTIAVTLARFVSFVRTLMPWFAGMSRLPYGRFLCCDLVGIVGWSAASIAAGYLAAESWQQVVHWFGTATALALVALVLGTASLLRLRRRVMLWLLRPRDAS